MRKMDEQNPTHCRQHQHQHHSRRVKSRRHTHTRQSSSRSSSPSRSSPSSSSTSTCHHSHHRHHHRHHRHHRDRSHRRRKPHHRSRGHHHRHSSHTHKHTHSSQRHGRHRRRRRRRRISSSCSRSRSRSRSCGDCDEHAAAVAIQRTYRGSMSRRALVTDNALYERLAMKIVEEMIEDVLLGEEVPNLLIDVLTNRTHEYDAFPEEELQTFDLCHSILGKVTEEESRSVVTEYLHEFVHDYLASMASKTQAHPLVTLLNGLVDEVLNCLHVEIVKASVAEMVDEYLFLHSFEAFLYQALEPVIYAVVVEANEDLEMEREEERMRENVCKSIAVEVGEETLREMAQVVDRRQTAFMKKQLATLNETIIDYVLLEELMKAVANRGESVAMRECLEELKMIHIGKGLLSIVVSKEKAQLDMVNNPPLRMVHQLVAASALFQPMLVQLENEMLLEAEEADKKELHQ